MSFQNTVAEDGYAILKSEVSTLTSFLPSGISLILERETRIEL